MWVFPSEYLEKLKTTIDMATRGLRELKRLIIVVGYNKESLHTSRKTPMAKGLFLGENVTTLLLNHFESQALYLF